MQCVRSKALRSAQQATLTASRSFSCRNVPRPAKLLPMMHLAAGVRCPTSTQRRAFAMASRPDLPKLDGLQIEVLTEAPSAKRFTKRGDTIDVHYKGTLTNGDKFDASYDRGQPLSFTVGKGQVIKGWDEGLLNMAVGDKRKLTIAPEIAYGQRAMGPIPAGSTLIFETELVNIKGVSKDEL